GWILKRSFRGAARLQVAVQLGPLAAEVDQIALHALGNDLLGRAAAIDLGDGRAAPLKLLIDLKKVRELVADMGRKVIIVLVEVPGWVVLDDRNDLVVALAAINHTHNADRIALHHNRGVER